jgi:hypothetical protein
MTRGDFPAAFGEMQMKLHLIPGAWMMPHGGPGLVATKAGCAIFQEI